MEQTFSFGDFELDAARFELRRAGSHVEVQPKVLRLLVYLVLNRERAVPAEELQRALWPETTVGPGSLKRAVLGARSVLGERGDSQSSIRTARGHGYQFVRPLQLMAAAPTRQQPAAASRTFLGRESVLELLETHLDATLHGETRCVLLTGAPGIGKTSALEELCARAAVRGSAVWTGRCSDLEGVPAFWPFIQVLRAALREHGEDEVRKLMGHGAADIAAAMPELRRADASPLPTEAARFRFFDSLTVFLSRSAERRPLLIALDDLQHADPASLQLLTFILRNLTRERILIAGTFRRDAAALEALLREPRAHCIELPGLTRSALAQYIELSLGHSLSNEGLTALEEQTAGNPLFVRQLVEQCRVSFAGDWTKLQAAPAALSGVGLHGAIERHLETVPDACRSQLQVASVLGREFSGALLAQVSGAAIATLWHDLALAQATQLIEPLPNDVGRFRFTHALIREALYRRLSADQRASLHGAAARAIEAQGLGDNQVLLAEVTHHFVQAAPAHDGGLALSYCVRAGETALSRLAYEEAAAHFERALQLSVYAAPEPRRRMLLLFRKGEALARTTDHATARAALFEALNLARELGDADMLFQTASLIASPPESGSVDAAQLAALQDALAALPAHDERRALLQAAIAKGLAYGGEQAARVQLALEALQRARQISDLSLRSEVLFRCHEALPSNLSDRVAIAAELLQLAHQQAQPGALLRAWAAQIETCVSRGDSAGASAALASMESLAERAREPFFVWRAKVLHGLTALLQGDLSSCERHARDALTFGAPLGEERARRIYCAQSVTVLMLQNRAAEAEPLGREMALRYPTVPGWVARLGSIEWTLGQHDQARRCLATVMDRGLAWICSEPLVVSGLCTVAGLATQLRDTQACKLLYGALLPYADHHGLTLLGATSYGPITRHLALLAAHAGELTLAEQHFRDALEGAERMRSPTFWALTGAGYAQLLLHSGKPEQRQRASELVVQTRDHAQRCGLTALQNYCAWLSKQHGLAPHLQLVARERR